MANVIKDYGKKKKDGYYDWTFADNPDKGKGGGVSAIPAHGNHPIFDKPGTVKIPRAVKEKEAELNKGK